MLLVKILGNKNSVVCAWEGGASTTPNCFSAAHFAKRNTKFGSGGKRGWAKACPVPRHGIPSPQPPSFLPACWKPPAIFSDGGGTSNWVVRLIFQIWFFIKINLGISYAQLLFIDPDKSLVRSDNSNINGSAHARHVARISLHAV